ncbi:MAG: hypothetical protein NTY19_27390, partial [Planctomycetota bacterium]|nr:hypothetical protein [Planctomycetota bacterium]
GGETHPGPVLFPALDTVVMPQKIRDPAIAKTGPRTRQTGPRSIRRRQMPVLFGNALHCRWLIGWGILTGLTVADDGTRCIISDLRTIPGDHSTQELVLRSTGRRIAIGFIRPYAIVETPAFIGRRSRG